METRGSIILYHRAQTSKLLTNSSKFYCRCKILGDFVHQLRLQIFILKRLELLRLQSEAFDQYLHWTVSSFSINVLTPSSNETSLSRDTAAVTNGHRFDNKVIFKQESQASPTPPSLSIVCQITTLTGSLYHSPQQQKLHPLLFFSETLGFTSWTTSSLGISDGSY